MLNAYGGYGKRPFSYERGKMNAMGGLFVAIPYTTHTKTKKRHGVTQKADGINTSPVKHQNAPADKLYTRLPLARHLIAKATEGHNICG